MYPVIKYMLFSTQSLQRMTSALSDMKHPSSPASPEGEVVAGSELCIDLGHGDGDPPAKRERKQRTLTLCEVCNIQLNSSAQAQIHYNGKTHQRRLRQASKAKTNRAVSNNKGESVCPSSCPCFLLCSCNF